MPGLRVDSPRTAAAGRRRSAGGQDRLGPRASRLPRRSGAPLGRGARSSPGERSRERLLAEGSKTLGDAELLALVLRTGSGEQDAVALAGTLLKRFGGVGGVLSQSSATLLRVSGLGRAKVASLVVIRELLARAELAKVSQAPQLGDPSTVGRYLSLELADVEREVFGAVMLDTRLHVLAIEHLFFGTVNRASVHSREVVKRCLHHNAAGVVLYHNHPSGNPAPSPADRDITRRLKGVLEEIDVDLVDHVVLGRLCQTSMADEGMLP